MINGIWSFNVHGPQIEFTSGILVVFADYGYVGGDSSYYFSGRFALDGAHVSSEATVKHHFGPKAGALGEFDRFTLTLAGTANVANSIIQLAGSIVEKPEIRLHVGMCKLEGGDGYGRLP
jgi:hypothetical protein